MTRVQTLSLAIGVALVALAVGWMAGRATQDASPAGSSAEATTEPKVLYYRNPMGLPDTSPVPKKDPMGMDYVPVYAGDAPPATPGTVVLPPDKVQALGVRTEAVKRGALASTVRTSGTVEVDETRQYAIAPRFEGWVERLYANQTGMRVRAGQPLLSVYSPQLAAAQQEYRLADETARRLAESDPASAASITARVLASSTRRVRQQIAPAVRADTPPSANTAATRGSRNRNATAIDNCPDASRFPSPRAAPTSATAASQPSQAHHCRPSSSLTRSIARSATAVSRPAAHWFSTRAKWIIKSTTPASWTGTPPAPIPECSNMCSSLPTLLRHRNRIRGTCG